MDLRIEDNSFRFCITPENLEALLRGREIDHRVCIGAHCFTCRITPLTRMESMTLEMAVAGFCLSVPRAVLEHLRDGAAESNALSVTQGSTRISLCVAQDAGIKEAA